MCISDPGGPGSAIVMEKVARAVVQAIVLSLLAACGTPEPPASEAGSQPAAQASAGRSRPPLPRTPGAELPGPACSAMISARLQRYAITGSRYGEPSLLGERVIEP